MKTARPWIFVGLLTLTGSLQAQTPCTWNQTASDKITETCGSVGIGTSVPGAELEVTSATKPNVELRIVAGPGASPATRLRFVGDRMWTLGTLEFAPGKFTLWDPNSAVFRMVFDPAAGVGFGTSAPWGGLHVFGAGQSSASPVLTSTSASTNGATLFLQDSGGAPGNGGMIAFGAGQGHFAAIKGAISDGSNHTLGNLVFVTRNASTDVALAERMRIRSDGRIAIGTTNPAALLHVLQTDPSIIGFQAEMNATIGANAATLAKAEIVSATKNVLAGVTDSGEATGSHTQGLNTGPGTLGVAAGEAIYAGNLGSGKVNTAFGTYIGVVAGQGTVTTGYGIYLQDIAATTGYSFYQAGANDMNYFAGKVGIGTVPSYPLHVVGNAYIQGELTGTKITAHYQDLAEWVPSREDLKAGTVVVLDPAVANMVMQSTKSYDTSVAGVVSAEPGIVLGVADAKKEQIATTGRVKVHVDATRAPIHIGDLLVTSNTPGMAMRSLPVEIAGVTMHRPGTIIGKALESLERGQGEILVLLSLQ